MKEGKKARSHQDGQNRGAVGFDGLENVALDQDLLGENVKEHRNSCHSQDRRREVGRSLEPCSAEDPKAGDGHRHDPRPEYKATPEKVWRPPAAEPKSAE